MNTSLDGPSGYIIIDDEARWFLLDALEKVGVGADQFYETLREQDRPEWLEKGTLQTWLDEKREGLEVPTSQWNKMPILIGLCDPKAQKLADLRTSQMMDPYTQEMFNELASEVARTGIYRQDPFVGLSEKPDSWKNRVGGINSWLQKSRSEKAGAQVDLDAYNAVLGHLRALNDRTRLTVTPEMSRHFHAVLKVKAVEVDAIFSATNAEKGECPEEIRDASALRRILSAQFNQAHEGTLKPIDSIRVAYTMKDLAGLPNRADASEVEVAQARECERAVYQDVLGLYQ